MYSAVIIGSGFSGICMGIKLKEKGIDNFVILEKAGAVGGTWRENTYPGAECDIPSALYSYSFEPYPDWEYKWSHQPQILEYLKMCCSNYGLDDHLIFKKELVEAKWEQNGSQWRIETSDGSIYNSRTFIIAVGQLHHPSFPDIEGIKEYGGPSFHSAQWDHNVSMEHKKVGVVGSAASAIQFIPQIAKTCSEVYVFQRTPNWMLPKQDRAYKPWEKSLVKRFPFLLKLYRLRLWLLGGGLFFLMKNQNNLLRKFYQGQTKKYIKKHIKDPELIAKLIPDYPMGAKRILFSDDYYEAISQEHVNLVTDPIEKIDYKGVQTSKNNYSLDAIIYATGFHTNPFLKNLKIEGRDHIKLENHWKNGPKNYLGITVDLFPNMFLMYGPNTNLGHNSIIIMSEAQAHYIAQCVEKLEHDSTSSLEVKSEIIDSYYQSIQSRLENMIWAEIEKSWYRSPTGQIANNWPGRTMEYTRKTKKVDFEDYIVN